MDSTNPTDDQYKQLQKAFEHFNKTLFSDFVPQVLLTMQRQKNVAGYASHRRFRNDDGNLVDEIALNPEYFGRSPAAKIEILATLVHEMAHIWQFHHGKPGRGRYHNAEWADKMESIGLMPSSTGKPGGKRTGDSMADYPIEGGRFIIECAFLFSEEFNIPWSDRAAFKPSDSALTNENGGENAEGDDDQDQAPDPKKKVKYSHQCDAGKALNVWGKPGLSLLCGTCQKPYEPA